MPTVQDAFSYKLFYELRFHNIYISSVALISTDSEGKDLWNNLLWRTGVFGRYTDFAEPAGKNGHWIMPRKAPIAPLWSSDDTGRKGHILACGALPAPKRLHFDELSERRSRRYWRLTGTGNSWRLQVWCLSKHVQELWGHVWVYCSFGWSRTDIDQLQDRADIEAEFLLNEVKSNSLGNNERWAFHPSRMVQPRGKLIIRTQ